MSARPALPKAIAVYNYITRKREEVIKKQRAKKTYVDILHLHATEIVAIFFLPFCRPGTMNSVLLSLPTGNANEKLCL